jgi:hypothetical protein
MNFLCSLCLVGVLFLGFNLPAVAGGAKIRVLIVDGFSNHDWRQTTTLIHGILAALQRRYHPLSALKMAA